MVNRKNIYIRHLDEYKMETGSQMNNFMVTRSAVCHLFALLHATILNAENTLWMHEEGFFSSTLILPPPPPLQLTWTLKFGK